MPGHRDDKFDKKKFRLCLRLHNVAAKCKAHLSPFRNDVLDMGLAHYYRRDRELLHIDESFSAWERDFRHDVDRRRRP